MYDSWFSRGQDPNFVHNFDNPVVEDAISFIRPTYTFIYVIVGMQ